MKSYHKFLLEASPKDRIPNLDGLFVNSTLSNYLSAEQNSPSLKAAVQYVNLMVKRAPDSLKRRRKGDGAGVLVESGCK